MSAMHRFGVVFPWMGVVLVLALAGLAWFQVGHWPYYSNPDPKDVVLGGLKVGHRFLPIIVVWVLSTAVIGAGLSFYYICVVAENRWALSHVESKRASVALAKFAMGFLCLLMVAGYHLEWLLD